MKKHLLHHQKIHQVEPETVVQPEAQVELETVVQPETQVEPETVVQPEVQVEPEAAVQPEAQVEPEAVVQPEIQVELQEEKVVPPEVQPSRFFFAVLSGVVFFAAYAPVTIGNKTIDALIYSVTYNGSYLAAEGIITIIVISIPPVKKALDYVKQMANSR